MYQLIRNRKYLALLAFFLVSCTAVSQTTFNEKLAIGYSSVTQVRVTATTLLQAKKITADDAQNVLATTDTARAGLDIARSLSTTDIAAAGNKLQAATAILTAASTYLATKQ